MSSMGASTIFASDVGSVSVPGQITSLTNAFSSSLMTTLQGTVAIRFPDGGLCLCAGIPFPMLDMCLPSQKFRVVWHSAFSVFFPFFWKKVPQDFVAVYLV
jgi:hypothetical protein